MTRKSNVESSAYVPVIVPMLPSGSTCEPPTPELMQPTVSSTMFLRAIDSLRPLDDGRHPNSLRILLLGPKLSFSDPSSTSAHSRRSSLDKLLEILHRRDAEHEPPLLVRDDGKVAPFRLDAVAGEEGLELLEGRLHGDDAVGAALALEADHGLGKGVLGLDLAGIEEGLEVGDGEVADEGAVGVDNG